MESRTDGFGGPFQLIDQLGIVRVDDHRLVFSPSPRTAVRPAFSPVKFASQYSLSRMAVASLMWPGAVRTPAGLAPRSKKRVDERWISRPCVAARPQA